MIEILLPRTDAGVVVQFVLATLILSLVIWRLWKRKDARLFVIGLWLVTYAGMGLRALH